MSNQQLNIDLKYTQKLQDSVLLTLNSIPYATIIFLSRTREIHLNKFALQCLELKDDESFDVQKWNKLNPHLDKTIEKNKQNFLLNQKALVTLFNGRKEVMDFNISTIRETALGDVHIIYFCKSSTKHTISSISSLYILKEEFKKLKPYLNNTGKAIHEDMMQKYFQEDQRAIGIDDLMYFEREMVIIQNTFPFLSHQEVIVCSLLVNNMENDEISILMKKSMNSVFVMIHRINKKLNVKDRKELIKLLNWVTHVNSDESQDDLPTVEDFDL